MNEWVKFVKQWSLNNNVNYRDAMTDPRCKNAYFYKNKTLTGGGFTDYARKASDILIGKDTINKMNALINGRNAYPPKVRDILNKYGNEIITSVVIKRNPLSNAIMNVLNTVSLGSFKNKLDRSEYDKLFHLQIVITTNTNKIISIEKNEVINMSLNPSSSPNMESSIVHNLPQGLTLQNLMENTKNYMKNSMFSYSAKDNNCQDFVMGILNGNNIGDDENRSFTKQDTESLFGSSDYLRKISNTVTDMGEKVNIITNGAGIKNNKKCIKHLKYKK